MMEKTNSTPRQNDDAFELREKDQANDDVNQYQLIGPGIICDTEHRGYAVPGGQKQQSQGDNRVEIVLDSSEGFIPLWAKGTALHWRFQQRSLLRFKNPEAAKQRIKDLLGKALVAWGPAVPVKFTYDEDVWDFEIVVKQHDECNSQGCVLASTFFPDGGQHQFVIYPMMFTQSEADQVNTLKHECGHIFGLRHFFAQISETDAPSELFGKQNKFTIMNYGSNSKLTPADIKDLQHLYQLVWSGKLTKINGTDIHLVKPFSAIPASVNSSFVFADV